MSALTAGFPAKAGEARRGLALPRRGLWLWASAILVSNQLLSAVHQTSLTSPWRLISDLAAVGFFQIMAWCVIFHLLASSDPAPVARRRDFAIAFALCCLLFIPAIRMVQVVASSVAIVLWISGRADPKLRSAGIVLAALSVQQFWGHFVFDLFALPILRAETAVVGTILEAVRVGTEWRDNVIVGSSGFGIIVYSGCSSFHNLSLAMLCWLTVSRLQNQDWRGRDFVVGGMIGFVMIVCNVMRLCLMAWSPDLYEYWHEGLGAQIFAVSASVLVLLLSFYGSRPPARAS